MPDFEAIYAEHYKPVQRWISGRFGIEVAEDAAQETFLHAWAMWDEVSGVTKMRPWLIGIAKHVTGHMLRSSKRLSSHSDNRSSVTPFWDRAAGRTVEWSSAADLRQDAPRQDFAVYLDQLQAHFQGLGPAQQEALTALANGETATEFAMRTHRSKASVTMALSVGRLRLRERLQDDMPHVIN